MTKVLFIFRENVCGLITIMRISNKDEVDVKVYFEPIVTSILTHKWRWEAKRWIYREFQVTIIFVSDFKYSWFSFTFAKLNDKRNFESNISKTTNELTIDEFSSLTLVSCSFINTASTSCRCHVVSQMIVRIEIKWNFNYREYKKLKNEKRKKKLF